MAFRKLIVGGGLFGSKSDSSKTEVEASPKPVFGQSIFGGQTDSSKPLFGAIQGEGDSKPAFGQSIFGANTDSSPKPVFGQNVFGSKSTDTPKDLSAKPVFGQSNIFGSKTDTSVVQPVFGQSTMFSASKDTTPKTTVLGSSSNTNTDGNFFKSTGLDFASLASASPITPKIETLNSNNKVEFVGLTNNNSFSSFQKAKDKDNSNTDDGDNYVNVKIMTHILSLLLHSLQKLSCPLAKKMKQNCLVNALSFSDLMRKAKLGRKEAYRHMDDLNNTPRKTKHLYVEKAKDCLNKTLSLLQDPSIDNSHPLNSVVPQEIKNIQYSLKLTDDIESTKLMDNSSNSGESSMAMSSPRQSELENLCKQMATTLLAPFKDEMASMIKDAVNSMRDDVKEKLSSIVHVKDEMAFIKEKIIVMEENIKALNAKEKVKSSNAPSRDGDGDLTANVLDDLYIIEDEIQNQLYAANSTNIFGNYGQGSIPQPRLSMIPPAPQSTPTQNVNQNQMPGFPGHPMYNPAVHPAYYNNPMYAAKVMAEKQVLNQMGRGMLPYGLDQNLTMSPAMNQVPPNQMNMNQMPPNLNQIPPMPQSLESMSPNLYGLLNQQMPMNSTPTFRNQPPTYNTLE
uniref:Uncharacterized protein n=1 Tax=Megaselia scalaris TaxID=36166 RepID=T1GRV2_MEGSC